MCPHEINLEDQEVADTFEEAFSEGYWDEVQRSAHAILDHD